MSAPELLLDEPLAAVDVERRRRISLPAAREGRPRDPVIYVSHDRAEVDQLADRVSFSMTGTHATPNFQLLTPNARDR